MSLANFRSEYFQDSAELKDIAEKISAIYGNSVSIKPMSSGKIRVSIEFENIDKTHDFLKSMT